MESARKARKHLQRAQELLNDQGFGGRSDEGDDEDDEHDDVERAAEILTALNEEERAAEILTTLSQTQFAIPAPEGPARCHPDPWREYTKASACTNLYFDRDNAKSHEYAAFGLIAKVLHNDHVMFYKHPFLQTIRELMLNHKKLPRYVSLPEANACYNYIKSGHGPQTNSYRMHKRNTLGRNMGIPEAWLQSLILTCRGEYLHINYNECFFLPTDSHLPEEPCLNVACISYNAKQYASYRRELSIYNHSNYDYLELRSLRRRPALTGLISERRYFGTDIYIGPRPLKKKITKEIKKLKDLTDYLSEPLSRSQSKYILIDHVNRRPLRKDKGRRYGHALTLLDDIRELGLFGRLCGGVITHDTHRGQRHFVMFVRCGSKIQICNSKNGTCYPAVLNTDEMQDPPVTKPFEDDFVTNVCYVLAPIEVHIDEEWKGVPWSPGKALQLASMNEEADIIEVVHVHIERVYYHSEYILVTVTKVTKATQDEHPDECFRKDDKLLIRMLYSKTAEVMFVYRDESTLSGKKKIVTLDTGWETVQIHFRPAVTTEGIDDNFNDEMLDLISIMLKARKHEHTFQQSSYMLEHLEIKMKQKIRHSNKKDVLETCARLQQASESPDGRPLSILCGRFLNALD